MQKRHLFGTIATFVGGPLLLATLIEPAAPLRPDVPAAAGAAGAAGAAPARAVARAAAPAVAAGAAAVVAETVAADPVPLPGLADAAITRAGTDAGTMSPPSGYFRTLAHAGETDDAYAAALPESDFALTEAGLGAGIAAGVGLDGGLAASDGFAALPGGNVDLMLLAGFSTGGGGNSGGAGNSAGDPPAFGATDQAQLVSGVPEPASWLSFIAGLALIGFNLRDRSRMRNVVC